MLAAAIFLTLQATAVLGAYVFRPVTEPRLSQVAPEVQRALKELSTNIPSQRWRQKDSDNYFYAFEFNGKVNLTQHSLSFGYEKGRYVNMAQHGGKAVFSGDYKTFYGPSGVSQSGSARGSADIMTDRPFSFEYHVDYDTGAKHCSTYSYTYSDLANLTITFDPKITDGTAYEWGTSAGLTKCLYDNYYKLRDVICDKLVDTEEVDNKWEDKLKDHITKIYDDLRPIVKKLNVPPGEYWYHAVAEITIPSVSNVKISFENPNEFHVKVSNANLKVTNGGYGYQGDGTVTLDVKLKINEQDDGKVQLQARDASSNIVWADPTGDWESIMFLRNALNNQLAATLREQTPKPLETILNE